MTQNYSRSGGSNPRRPEQDSSRISNDLLSKIVFKELRSDIFSDIAEEAAKKTREAGADKKNKRTQLRRFYDELVMWNDNVQQAQGESRETKYRELEPFIKMLKAKVVYAKGRDHVDVTFETLFAHCVGKIESAETLKHCKLFMEAFMGFYKALDEK